MKRITFNEHDASHLYELAREHFCTGPRGMCFACEQIQNRLEKFIGKKQVRAVERTIRRNGYCNKLRLARNGDFTIFAKAAENIKIGDAVILVPGKSTVVRKASSADTYESTQKRKNKKK